MQISFIFTLSGCAHIDKKWEFVESVDESAARTSEELVLESTIPSVNISSTTSTSVISNIEELTETKTSSGETPDATTTSEIRDAGEVSEEDSDPEEILEKILLDVETQTQDVLNWCAPATVSTMLVTEQSL